MLGSLQRKYAVVVIAMMLMMTKFRSGHGYKVSHITTNSDIIRKRLPRKLRRHHHRRHNEFPAVQPSNNSSYENMVQINSEGSFILYWNTPLMNAQNKVFDVQLVYSGKAWLGFGLLSPYREISNNASLLDGSEVVIGKPNSYSVRKYEIRGNHWTNTVRRESLYQTLQDGRIDQSNNSTMLSFKKLLKEDGEIPINPTGGNIFVFAYGGGNAFNKTGKSYMLVLDLVKGKNTSTPSMFPSIRSSPLPSSKSFFSPSSKPSASPSSKPSFSLSLNPSTSPSSKPIFPWPSMPSLTPSSVPSLFPSLNATTYPTHTRLITKNPTPLTTTSHPSQTVTATSLPSATPTSLAILHLSAEPTIFPTTEPSLSPSLKVNHTNLPSTVTTLLPTESRARIERPSLSPSKAPSLQLPRNKGSIIRGLSIQNRAIIIGCLWGGVLVIIGTCLWCVWRKRRAETLVGKDEGAGLVDSFSVSPPWLNDREEETHVTENRTSRNEI